MEESIPSRVSFILKCTRTCNFACNYCTDRRTHSPSLPFEAVVKLVKGACSQIQGIDFVFHGGEPLLLGKDFFRKFLAVEGLCSDSTHDIRNLIQTNGSLLSRDWCELFREFGLQVGVSLDGPKHIHNRNRLYANQEPTFQEVINGISTLQSENIPFGVLIVATEDLLRLGGKMAFKYFADLGIKRIAFLAERPGQMAFDDTQTARRFYEGRIVYARFLSDVYKAWLELNDPEVEVREISNKVKVMLGRRSQICSESGPCVGRYFGVDPEGNISHCDKFFQDTSLSFGNICEDSYESILGRQRITSALLYERKIRAQCSSCEWFHVCGGGCLYEALLFLRSGLSRREIYCHNKIIYDVINHSLERYLSGYIVPKDQMKAAQPEGSKLGTAGLLKNSQRNILRLPRDSSNRSQ